MSLTPSIICDLPANSLFCDQGVIDGVGAETPWSKQKTGINFLGMSVYVDDKLRDGEWYMTDCDGKIVACWDNPENNKGGE